MNREPWNIGLLRCLKELGIDDPLQERRALITFVETGRCLPDALQRVTGCRWGKRTLKFKELGRIRPRLRPLENRPDHPIAAKESANRPAIEMFPGRLREEALQLGYRKLSDDALFVRQSVRLSPA